MRTDLVLKTRKSTGVVSSVTPQVIRAPKVDPNIDRHCIYSPEELENWALIEALRSGTQGMRQLRTKYLPQFDGEKDQAYERRLSRSFLFDGYVNAVDKLSDKPFSREVTVTNCPEAVKYMLKDMDSYGTSLTAFADEMLTEAIDAGMVAVYVDFTSHEEVPISREEEKQLGLRCMVQLIHPKDLLEVRTRYFQGKTIITMIRFKYALQEDLPGECGQVTVNYVKVVDLTSFKIYKKKPEGEYELFSSGSHTFGEIPLVITYLNKTGYLHAKPCLMALAEKNIEHWQSSSEQRHILSFVRFATLFGKCLGMVDDDGKQKKVVVGPENAIMSENPDAELSYVEHTGSAIGAGVDDIKHIEEQMERLGAQPIMPRASYASATEKSLNKDDSTSSLKTWVKKIARALEEVLRIACKWHTNKECTDDFTVNIFMDFLIQVYGDTSITELLQLADGHYLTGESLLAETQRRGKLSELINCNEEFKKAQEQRVIKASSLEKIEKGGDNNGKNSKTSQETGPETGPSGEETS